MIFALCGPAYSHDKHSTGKPKPAPTSDDSERVRRLLQINEEYKKNIRSIFQKSCFDCHSQQTRYPWYYKIPGVKGLIDIDLAEAKKHINLTNNFPFQGHGLSEEDLSAIRKSLEGSTMPPFRYRILHPNSSLTSEEKQKIYDWIEKSIGLLTTE